MDKYNQLRYLRENFSFNNVFNEELNEARTTSINDKRKLEQILKTVEGVEQRTFEYDKRRDEITLVFNDNVVNFKADTWGGLFKLYYPIDLGISTSPQPVLEIKKGEPLEMKSLIFNIKNFYESCVMYKMMVDMQKQIYSSMEDKLSYIPAYYKYNEKFELLQTNIDNKNASVTLKLTDPNDKSVSVSISINSKGTLQKIERYESDSFENSSKILYPYSANSMKSAIAKAEELAKSLKDDISSARNISAFEEHIVDFFVKRREDFEEAIESKVIKSNSFIAKVKTKRGSGSSKKGKFL